MDQAVPNPFSLCCCVLFLVVAALGVLFAVPGARRAISQALGRSSSGGTLPPRLAQLSAAALPGLRECVLGMSMDHLRLASELVASIQLAHELLWPGIDDRTISNGVTKNRDAYLAGVSNALSQIQPRTPDINVAIATINVARRPEARLMVTPLATYFSNLAVKRNPPRTGA